jgi:hypothetical protein
MHRLTPFFIFDVESVGLHGQAFAVGGGVYIDGVAQSEFEFGCPINAANGDEEDREWVEKNVIIRLTHAEPREIQEEFWTQWKTAKENYPDILMAGECIWPVETNFVSSCVAADKSRKWAGPYPFIDISSVMAAAGMMPMKTYGRLLKELPAHNALADARLSARLLKEALILLEKSDGN